MDGSFIYGMLADAVVIIHLAFIVFVMAGGLLTVVFPRIVWIHVPCVAWGILVELAGCVCPLTPLENLFRSMSGRDQYAGDFVIHFIEPVIYPQGLTREIQVVLAGLVIMVNAGMYGWLVFRKMR